MAGINKESINILEVDDCEDHIYGRSIVQYKVNNFVSYIFSEEKSDGYDLSILKNEIIEHLERNGGITQFPLWSDLSTDLVGLITESAFDMLFIEEDDEDWPEEKTNSVLDEIRKWKIFEYSITSGENDDKFTCYADVMCEVNWFGNEDWGAKNDEN
jgi:hypothetical protein